MAVRENDSNNKIVHTALSENDLVEAPMIPIFNTWIRRVLGRRFFLKYVFVDASARLGGLCKN